MTAGSEIAGERNAETFADIVHIVRRRMYNNALRVVRNAADADDAVQEALSKAYQHIADCREEASLPAWLGRIAWNEGLALLRKRRSTGDVSIDTPPDEQGGWHVLRGHGPSPEQIASFEETRRQLRACVGRLKPKYREVLAMRGFEEMSNTEIAERLGVTQQTVKLRMHRARRQLQRVLGSDKGRLAQLSRAAA